MSGEEFGVLIPIVALCIPIVKIWTNHKLRLAEIQAGMRPSVNTEEREVNPNLAQAIDRLRQEMSALRETSTRFDMSFDAALSRLEQRMDGFESQAAAAVEPARYSAEIPAMQETMVAGSKV